MKVWGGQLLGSIPMILKLVRTKINRGLKSASLTAYFNLNLEIARVIHERKKEEITRFN